MSITDKTPPEKTAVILIGIPASGKSSFFATFCKGKYTHINLDTLRTRKKEASLLAECLMESESFVVDNTNLLKSDRQRYIVPAKAERYRVEGYFFQSVLADCIERNKKRSGKARIPDAVITSKSNMLELPVIDEGFDELFLVKLNKGRFLIEQWTSQT